MDGLSEAYVEAISAVARRTGVKPLPAGISSATVGDWEVAVNNGTEPLDHDGTEIAPFEVFARNNVYLAVATIGLMGGMIGGMSEAEFIDQMRGAA